MPPTPAPDAEDRADPLVEQALGLGHRRRVWPWVVGALVLVVGLLALVGSRVWAPDATAWRTAPVTRGELTLSVTTVGTLEPVDSIDVGSEQSGLVRAVHADVNDRVTAGQPLVELDTEVLGLQVAEARARVGAARAAVDRARVDSSSAAHLRDRTRALHASRAVTDEVLEQAEVAADLARASLASAEASLAQARAAASLAATQLDKAVIRSPIDGVVLRRMVDPGQSVVTALQASTLFTLAADLSRMKVEVEIDEADIGRVETGQVARFSVAAWPDRTFEAAVVKVHLAPLQSAQVVTYVAELRLDNTDLVLRPGMTATATLVTASLPDVLQVPTAALRFAPEEAADLPAPASRDGRRVARVWVPGLRGAEAREIVPGASDGAHTAVLEGALREGELVIVGLPPAPAP